VPYKKYVTDHKYLVEGNIKCCEKFGIDMVSAISDPYRETHGFGANIIFPEDDVPKCTDYLLKEYSDIKKLKINDPEKSERMFDRLKAIKLFKKELEDQYPILGWAEGPIAEATDLRGMGKIMTDIFDSPELTEELFEICTQQSIVFSEAQIDAGADMIGIGDAAASLIGPQIYKDMVLSYEKRVIEAIHKKGAKARLHICGNISSILQYLPLTGADIIDIDWMVDFKVANSIFKGKCAACGNFDPVKIMLNGNTDDVRAAVLSCIGDGNGTTFIAAGCEIPKMTPHENMLMVDATLKEASLNLLY
jgi:MtaA/CmuA family methyltransferase